MFKSGLSDRFQASTRGRLLALLRSGARTVEELASDLELTDNAIRQHLTSLERDGMIRQVGVRRGLGAGKPATVYEMDAEAEVLLSRAYAPVLGALLEVIADQLPPQQARKMLRETGRRVAAASGGRAVGDIHARAKAAAMVLTALGGMVHVEERRGGATLRGTACPLASAVARNPAICKAVESLVGEITGEDVKQCCDHTGRPRCCFEVPAAS